MTKVPSDRQATAIRKVVDQEIRFATETDRDGLLNVGSLVTHIIEAGLDFPRPITPYLVSLGYTISDNHVVPNKAARSTFVAPKIASKQPKPVEPVSDRHASGVRAVINDAIRQAAICGRRGLLNLGYINNLIYDNGLDVPRPLQTYLERLGFTIYDNHVVPALVTPSPLAPLPVARATPDASLSVAHATLVALPPVAFPPVADVAPGDTRPSVPHDGTGCAMHVAGFPTDKHQADISSFFKSKLPGINIMVRHIALFLRLFKIAIEQGVILNATHADRYAIITCKTLLDCERVRTLDGTLWEGACLVVLPHTPSARAVAVSSASTRFSEPSLHSSPHESKSGPMLPQLLTDDLPLLLNVMPPRVQAAIAALGNDRMQCIAEIILDVRRPLIVKLSNAAPLPLASPSVLEYYRRAAMIADEEEEHDESDSTESEDDGLGNSDGQDGGGIAEEVDLAGHWSPVSIGGQRLLRFSGFAVSTRDVRRLLRGKDAGTVNAKGRTGVKRALHRLSVVRDGRCKIVGVTCRVGRPIVGVVEGLALDQLEEAIEHGRSIVAIGPPGAGKTTFLREVAHLFTHRLDKSVVIVDGSNEIGGGTERCTRGHLSVGLARRLRGSSQDADMLEAVENHAPDVVIVDELSTSAEAQACQTIAVRGVSVVATAHGRSLVDLIFNQKLATALGGVTTSTLGDVRAMDTHAKSKIQLDAKMPPAFGVAIVFVSAHEWLIYPHLEKQVAIAVAAFSGRPCMGEAKENFAIRRMRRASGEVYQEAVRIGEEEAGARSGEL